MEVGIVVCCLGNGKEKNLYMLSTDTIFFSYSFNLWLVECETCRLGGWSVNFFLKHLAKYQ
jgi:hypothetical protein